MKKNVSRLVSMFLSIAPLMVQAEESFNLPVLRLPFMKTAPCIDGEIKESEWGGAARMEGLCLHGSGTLTGGKTSFWVGCDNRKLYIAMISETAPGGKLLARVAPVKDGNSRAYLDDNVEFILNPTPDAPKEEKFIYHAIINVKGAVYKQKYAAEHGGENWLGELEIKNRIIGDRWHFECAIPLQVLGVNSPLEGKSFGVRICRNWMTSQYGKASQWSPFGGPHVNTDTMPVITWDNTAPVVQNLQIINESVSKANLKLSLYNPGTQALRAVVDMQMRPRSSAHSKLTETVELMPGETKFFELKTPAAGNETVYAFMKVSSPDGGNIYYFRDFNLSASRNEPFFMTSESDAERINFNFAYYPSFNSMKVKVDFSALETKGNVKGAIIELRKKGESKVIGKLELKEVRNFSVRAEKWKLPELGEGEYELTLTLDGAKVNPLKDTFVRHKFPWEGNKIGMSDILIPPYTPIKIDGESVSTILRKHSIDKTGLWTQVEALGSRILNKPMRLELVSGGKTYIAEGTNFKWTEKRDTKAAAEGNWKAGPYSGSVKAEWDYDGLMKWTLELPLSELKIDSLRLIIPVDNSIASLMHVCTDGIRFNYAGYVPSGNGVVWTSAKAAHQFIVGNFVPYLWVGGEELGVCVSAENDKGWINAQGKSCQEIIRNGDSLELVYNLIAQPSVIKEARAITLAFQATPVKPMPENWRLKILGAAKARPFVNKDDYLGFLGSCLYWGGEVASDDHYPRGGDMGYLKKLAETRDSGVVDKAYIENWLKGYAKALEVVGNPDERKRMEQVYRNHVNYAFHGMSKHMCFYTNGRGVRLDTPEGQTFLNEWLISEFSTRKWKYTGCVAFDLDPVASFRDYAVWYLKQMAEICLDSVYWDDFFFIANFDTTVTDAYYLPDGNIQPSMGLYNMREYARRTAIMYLEMKRPVANIVHMTNAAITPVLSMAQMNYTWEDKSGDADFQDRFSRDYIRAESIGLQQGNIPYCLWLVNGKDKSKLAWAERTGAGVALTHEIKTSASPDVFWKTYKTMLDFGYGKPEVKVSQYWRKDHPVSFENIDTSSLVMSKPGAFLVLVCDWGNGGNALMSLDKRLFKDGAKLRAKDMESGESLDITPEGKFKFNIKRHDFKLILVEEDRP